MILANFWERQGKDTMRYVLATWVAAAMICAGCNKQEPLKPEPAPQMKPAATMTSVRPLLPADGEPGTTPTTISRPTPLVGPETTLPPVKSEPTVKPAPTGTTAGGPSATVAPGGVYVVKKGDTLWKIATAVYGDGKRSKDIVAANSGLDPAKLQVGQKLTMPK
jgi:nucleoid-associated protein YgaU